MRITKKGIEIEGEREKEIERGGRERGLEREG